MELWHYHKTASTKGQNCVLNKRKYVRQATVYKTENIYVILLDPHNHNRP